MDTLIRSQFKVEWSTLGEQDMSNNGCHDKLDWHLGFVEWNVRRGCERDAFP